jgi:aspartate carbamoyltransferase
MPAKSKSRTSDASPSRTNKKTKPTQFWQGKDVVTIDELDDIDAVFRLLDVADDLRNRKSTINICAGKIIALAFMEPSTRTSCSFSAAAQRLGAGVISTNAQESSVTKGETLSDTMICLASYADAIVLRHPKKGAAKEAADAVAKPVINAGDGTGEHPTQALLDLYTILRETSGRQFSEDNKLNLTFLGDAKNGRTIHSLSKLLTKVLNKRIRIRYVTPEAEDLRMPKELIEKLAEQDLEQSEHNDLSDEILASTDVLYVTRVQKERFTDPAAYERAMKGSFRVNASVMEKMKKDAVVMHPLPRVDEISTEVDADPRCAYFRQMENGMYVRMALLGMVLGDLE